MKIKTLLSILDSTHLDDSKELQVIATNNGFADKVVEIFKDNEVGALVFYTDNQVDNLQPSTLLDLKFILSTHYFDAEDDIYIDCNEYLPVSDIHTADTEELTIFI